jgi:hypothetical protein
VEALMNLKKGSAHALHFNTDISCHGAVRRLGLGRKPTHG